MIDDPGRSHKVRAIRAAIAGHDAGGLPGPGRTLAMACCLDCPFSACVDPGDEDSGWTCTTWWFPGFEMTPPAIDAKHLAVGPPPDWCPLRAGPVTLEVKP